MSHVDAPFERLQFFQGKLGLAPAEIASLDRYRQVFLARRDAFADDLRDFLCTIPETQRIVELMESRGGLRRNWRCWYEGFFTAGFDRQFYQFLWSSGLRHVTRNVDQRFIHLGYCRARLFIGGIIDREIPRNDASRVRAVVDKMVDQCLLVATDAFLAGTTQCDREVINGIAHQVRNPLTVIGGFVTSLQKRVPAESPIQPVLDTMLLETRRLEAMVRDVGTYIEIMQKEPEFALCSLEDPLNEALRRLRGEGWTADVDVRLGEAGQRPLISARSLLEELFYHLLQNSFEATHDEPRPIIRVTGRFEGVPPTALTVEIFNNGHVPLLEEVEHLFTPFQSSKPLGSGFGLPIAGLVTRKVHGELDLVPIPGQGTRTTVALPV
jgi:signal transduction histidine kinase